MISMDEIDWDLEILKRSFNQFSSETTFLEQLKTYLAQHSLNKELFEYLLNQCCMQNLTFIFDYLITLKYDLHYTDELPLRLSVKHNAIDLCKCLVEDHDANVHVQKEYCSRYCVKNGNAKLLHYFGKFTPNYDAMDNAMIKTSVQLGNLSITTYLVDMGADYFFDDGSIILSAITSGNIELVKYLKRKGLTFSKFEDEIYVICLTNEDYGLLKALKKMGLKINKSSHLYNQIRSLKNESKKENRT